MLLALLAACSGAPTTPPAAPAQMPTATAPKPAFDCVGWVNRTHLASGTPMCSESPHVPGLWLVEGPSGGEPLSVAVANGQPLKGGGGAAAAFLRSIAVWTLPVNAADVARILAAFGAYPPGFANRSPATFEPPFTYQLTVPLNDWTAHGGPNSVAGALPAGPLVRGTLTTGPDAPTQWVIESGSGQSWSPTATIRWDKGPVEGPMR